MFSCEGLDLKQRWLAVFKAAVTGVTPACSLTGPDNSVNGSRCVINGNVSDRSVCSGKEMNGNKENHT